MPASLGGPIALDANERIFRFLATLWEKVCRILMSPLVVRQWNPKDKKLSKFYADLVSENILFYTWDQGSDLEPQDEDPARAALLEKAAFLYNTCVLSNAALYPVIKALINGHPEILDVKWIYRLPRPQLVFMPPTSQGTEPPSLHDAFRLEGQDGGHMVFDPTGGQFGFTEVLVAEEDYEAKYVKPGNHNRGERSFDEQNAIIMAMETDPDQRPTVQTVIFVQRFTLQVIEHVLDKLPDGQSTENDAVPNWTYRKLWELEEGKWQEVKGAMTDLFCAGYWS